jgi:hypothetical protein
VLREPDSKYLPCLAVTLLDLGGTDPDLAVRIFKPDERLLLPKCLHALSFADNILALDLVFIVGC